MSDLIKEIKALSHVTGSSADLHSRTVTLIQSVLDDAKDSTDKSVLQCCKELEGYKKAITNNSEVLESSFAQIIYLLEKVEYRSAGLISL